MTCVGVETLTVSHKTECRERRGQRESEEDGERERRKRGEQGIMSTHTSTHASMHTHALTQSERKRDQLEQNCVSDLQFI